MKYAVVILSLIFFVGCKSDKKDYVKCDKVVNVLSFPEEIDLKNPYELSIDLIGCVDVVQADSLLICKREGEDKFWEIYSLNMLKSYGKYFRKGHGKNEFEWMPTSENVYYVNDSLYCDIYKSSSNKLYTCNLTSTVQCKELSMSEKFDFSAYGDMCDVIDVDDSTYFCVKYNKSCGFLRAIVDYAGNEHVVDPGNLNRVGTDEISILSSYRIVNTKQKMVVEGMLRFPQINLYSLDNDMNITLSMEPELRSKSSIENCSKSARRKYFGEIQSMENFFGAMYYDIPLKDFYDGSGKGSKILFFKWDGTPVLKINLAYIATSFFIYKNKLYVFSGSGEKECLKMYDCPSILTK